MSRPLIRGQIYTLVLSLHAGAKYGAKAYQTERRKGLRWQRTSLLRNDLHPPPPPPAEGDTQIPNFSDMSDKCSSVRGTSILLLRLSREDWGSVVS